MAAKSRKNCNQISKLLGFGAALFALVAVIMLFLSGVDIKSGSDKYDSYSVLKVAFGGVISENTALGITVKTVFKFNFLTCLAAIFIVLGLVFVVLSLAKIGNSKLMAFVGAVLLIAGAVFVFCLISLTTIQTTTTAGSTTNVTTKKLSEMDSDYVKLGIGAILAGSFGIAGGVASLGKVIFGK